MQGGQNIWLPLPLGQNVESKIELKKVSKGPAKTNFPVFNISFVILSKDEALLLSSDEIALSN